jgi:hypothetical protein
MEQDVQPDLPARLVELKRRTEITLRRTPVIALKASECACDEYNAEGRGKVQQNRQNKWVKQILSFHSRPPRWSTLTVESCYRVSRSDCLLLE